MVRRYWRRGRRAFRKCWVRRECISILAMRFIAALFLRFVERAPILKPTAYVLIIFIGLKLLAAASEYEAYIRGETLARSVDFDGVDGASATTAGNGAGAQGTASAATIEGRELRIGLARAA